MALFLKSNPKFPIYAVKWDKLFPPVNVVFKRARDTEYAEMLGAVRNKLKELFEDERYLINHSEVEGVSLPVGNIPPWQ